MRFFGAVEVLDELRHAAAVGEGFLLAGAFVGQLDGQALVEEGQLAQAVFQGVVVEGGVVEDLGVGLEGDLGAGAVAGRDADLLDVGDGLAAFVFLHVDLAAAANLGLGPFATGP